MGKRGRMQKTAVNSLPSLLTNLTHSFLPQNSPFLGTEVIVFFLATHRLPNQNPCFFNDFMLKK